jgi:hypothetical protein
MANRRRYLQFDVIKRAKCQAMNYAATGRIWLPPAGLAPGMQLDDIESEWYRFTGDQKRDANDDAVEMLSYAVKASMTQQQGVASCDGVPMVLGGWRY